MTLDDCLAEARAKHYEVHNLYEDGFLWHVRLKINDFLFAYGNGDSPPLAFEAALRDAPRRIEAAAKRPSGASPPHQTLLEDL